IVFFFFFQAEDGIRDFHVTGVQTCALPIFETAREELIEALAEFDDEIMVKYLEGEALSVDEIKRALRKATLSMGIVPLLCGSSFKNKGVQSLLDAVVDYLPSPVDLPPVVGTVPGTSEEVTREHSDDAPFAALAFKIMADPYVGKLAYFR